MWRHRSRLKVFYFFFFFFFFNRLYNRGYTVHLYTCIFNVCSPIFFRRMLNFDNFFFVVGKISASWWSRSKSFLDPCVVNLSVCLFNILFGYCFRKNRTMTMKFLYVLELQRFGLHIKNCYSIVHRSFYGAFKKF